MVTTSWAGLLLVVTGAAGAADGVALRPVFEPGRARHAVSVEQPVLPSDPTAEAIEMQLSTTWRDASTVVLRTWSPNPLPLWSLIEPELTTEVAYTFGEDGEIGSAVTLQDDHERLMRWMLGGASLPSGPPSAASLATGPCGDLNAWLVLPADPVAVGATWTVGALSCAFDGLEGSQATVSCEASWDDDGGPMTWHRRSERTMWIDVDARELTRCERSDIHTADPVSTPGRPVDPRVLTSGSTQTWRPVPAPEAPAGCGCSVQGTRGPAWLALMAWLGVRRRPRRSEGVGPIRYR